MAIGNWNPVRLEFIALNKARAEEKFLAEVAVQRLRGNAEFYLETFPSHVAYTFKSIENPNLNIRGVPGRVYAGTLSQLSMLKSIMASKGLSYGDIRRTLDNAIVL